MGLWTWNRMKGKDRLLPLFHLNSHLWDYEPETSPWKGGRGRAENLNSHLWDYEPETPCWAGTVFRPCTISIPIYGIMNLKLFFCFLYII